jgi:hypothetical protein
MRRHSDQDDGAAAAAPSVSEQRLHDAGLRVLGWTEPRPVGLDDLIEPLADAARALGVEKDGLIGFAAAAVGTDVEAALEHDIELLARAKLSVIWGVLVGLELARQDATEG